MLWLVAFVVALFLIALPTALFARNEAAAAVFLAWCLGQLAYAAGVPEAAAQTIIYGVTFSVLCIRIVLAPHCWSWRCVGIAILFLPLAAVSCRWARGAPEPYWPIYWLGVTQMVLMLRPVQWWRATRMTAAKARSGWGDHFSMATP